MGTFLEIATPLIQRSILVIPMRPFSKRGLRDDQFEIARLAAAAEEVL